MVRIPFLLPPVVIHQLRQRLHRRRNLLRNIMVPRPADLHSRLPLASRPQPLAHDSAPVRRFARQPPAERLLSARLHAPPVLPSPAGEQLHEPRWSANLRPASIPKPSLPRAASYAPRHGSPPSEAGSALHHSRHPCSL